jgi:hypothetical protein
MHHLAVPICCFPSTLSPQLPPLPLPRPPSRRLGPCSGSPSPRLGTKPRLVVASAMRRRGRRGAAPHPPAAATGEASIDAPGPPGGEDKVITVRCIVLCLLPGARCGFRGVICSAQGCALSLLEFKICARLPVICSAASCCIIISIHIHAYKLSQDLQVRVCCSADGSEGWDPKLVFSHA